MSVVTEEQWVAIWKAANIGHTIDGSGIPPYPGLVGRSITIIVKRLVQFWSDHRDTLAPVMAQIAVAALDAVVMALPSILSVNEGGPG